MTGRVLARTTVALHDNVRSIPANTLTWVDPDDEQIKQHLKNGLLVRETTGPQEGVGGAAVEPPQQDTSSVPSENA